MCVCLKNEAQFFGNKTEAPNVGINAFLLPKKLNQKNLSRHVGELRTAQIVREAQSHLAT